MLTQDDDVVLLGPVGEPVGTARRSAVHSDVTPLHLAYSCHVTDRAGRVLVTRRALDKTAWPGVWTNAFCGHPRPGESVVEAVRRGARHELGVELLELRVLLPSFRYRATDARGVVENELCPVYAATIESEPEPNPTEVLEHAWLTPDDLATAVRAAPFAFSPWLALQLDALEQLRLAPQPAGRS